MSKHEIQSVLDLGRQYLNPQYNVEGDIEAQRESEEGNFNLVIKALAREDQDVLKIWKVIQKKKNQSPLKP